MRSSAIVSPLANLKFVSIAVVSTRCARDVVDATSSATAVMNGLMTANLTTGSMGGLRASPHNPPIDAHQVATRVALRARVLPNDLQHQLVRTRPQRYHAKRDRS